MNKRIQRKMVARLATDCMDAVRVYGEGRLARAVKEQYAWVLYYAFRKGKAELPKDGATRLFVETALDIVRHRRSCGRRYGAAKVYLKMHGRSGHDEE